MDNSNAPHRFRRISRHNPAHLNLRLDDNLEQWPHLNELLQCYTSDWVKDESKYGHYESVSPPHFHNQIFEGPDTDIQTEMNLANARRTKGEDATDDDTPSTSGRQFADSHVSQRFGQSPLPAYEPAFDWENERSMIFGQWTPETPVVHHGSGLKISVKVLFLTFQAGIIEPFYGTICLYNGESREKLSKDFYFSVLPTENLSAIPKKDPGVTLGLFFLFSLSFLYPCTPKPVL
ncbi:hypothetical protein SLA2020_142300 [Shorea laevis]